MPAFASIVFVAIFRQIKCTLIMLKNQVKAMPDRVSIRLDANTMMRLSEFSNVTGVTITSTVRFAINEQLNKVYDSDGYIKKEFILQNIDSAMPADET